MALDPKETFEMDNNHPSRGGIIVRIGIPKHFPTFGFSCAFVNTPNYPNGNWDNCNDNVTARDHPRSADTDNLPKEASLEHRTLIRCHCSQMDTLHVTWIFILAHESPGIREFEPTPE